MRRLLRAAVLLALALAVLPMRAQQGPTGPERVRERYTKYEYRVPMRDSVHLFTSVYVPKDTSKRYPAILNVGGWFDAEDPMGPLHMYRAIERLSPAIG